MIRVLLLAICQISALLPGSAAADANDGEFMGYRLGDRYPLTAETRSGPSLSGNLVLIAQAPVKPADIGEVRLTTTVETYTIGFIEASQTFATENKARAFAKKYYELLHAKYPDWQIENGTIQIDDATLMPTALNMDKWPYTIRMKLTNMESPSDRPFRLSMTLRYLFDSPERKQWNALAHAEQQQSSQQKLLDESDARGL